METAVKVIGIIGISVGCLGLLIQLVVNVWVFVDYTVYKAESYDRIKQEIIQQENSVEYTCTCDYCS